ncbi:MAG: hypothetical protein SFX72_13160 [Isosphaeraceae bacterium]|nr:hypothetical protein [Isosphaeraceae bacterium]
MDLIEFRYVPACSAPGCAREAVYKIAAPWSSRAGSELKTYGLACEEHRVSQLMRGRLHRRDLVVADDETVGEVGLYRAAPGAAGSNLERLADFEHDHA